MPAHDRSLSHSETTRSVARRRGEVAAAAHRGEVATVRAALDDPDAPVRATAVGGLVRAGAATLADLRQALGDPAAAVRRRAAEVAWRAAADPAAVAGLVEPLLADDDPFVVEAACFCLGELQSRPSVVALSAVATGAADPLCREAAVAALGAIGDEAGLEAVLAGTHDRPAVRRRAVLALAAFDGPSVDAAIERALGDRDWQVRQAAEDLSGRRGG